MFAPGGLIAVAMAFALNAVSPGPALAWGDEGHEIIALIAQAYLARAFRRQSGERPVNQR
jgi:hypothetical protein